MTDDAKEAARKLGVFFVGDRVLYAKPGEDEEYGRVLTIGGIDNIQVELTDVAWGKAYDRDGSIDSSRAGQLVVVTTSAANLRHEPRTPR